MSNSCYLLASLPTLFFGKDPGVTYNYFLDVTGRFLNKGQRNRLYDFNYHKPPQAFDILPRPERDYWFWETGLRNELVRIRAEMLGLKPDSHLRNPAITTSGMRIAREVMRIGDPLRVEKMLTRSRYDWLEMQRGGSIFGFRILLIYSMQLQILQRYNNFDPVVGSKNYEEMYQRIYSESESVVLEKIS